jgi:hypothetical protein
MRTTININDNLLNEAKKLSLTRHCSLGEVVNEALRLSLTAQRKATSVNDSTRPLITFNGSGTQSGVDLNNSASLLKAMDA